MNICTNCSHCLQTSTNDCATIYQCKKCYRISPVTGYKIYDYCDYLNKHGNCENYEPNFITRVGNKIKQLFKIK